MRGEQNKELSKARWQHKVTLFAICVALLAGLFLLGLHSHYKWWLFTAIDTLLIVSTILILYDYVRISIENHKNM